MRLRRRPGKSAGSSRDHVVRHDVPQSVEPERRDLREDLALVGDARAEHVVERGDAIGGDDQQPSPKIVDVADLAVDDRADDWSSVVSRIGEASGNVDSSEREVRRCIASDADRGDNNNI